MIAGEPTLEQVATLASHAPEVFCFLLLDMAREARLARLSADGVKEGLLCREGKRPPAYCYTCRKSKKYTERSKAPILL